MTSSSNTTTMKNTNVQQNELESLPMPTVTPTIESIKNSTDVPEKNTSTLPSLSDEQKNALPVLSIDNVAQLLSFVSDNEYLMQNIIEQLIDNENCSKNAMHFAARTLSLKKNRLMQSLYKQDDDEQIDNVYVWQKWLKHKTPSLAKLAIKYAENLNEKKLSYLSYTTQHEKLRHRAFKSITKNILNNQTLNKNISTKTIKKIQEWFLLKTNFNQQSFASILPLLMTNEQLQPLLDNLIEKMPKIERLNPLTPNWEKEFNEQKQNFMNTSSYQDVFSFWINAKKNKFEIGALIEALHKIVKNEESITTSQIKVPSTSFMENESTRTSTHFYHGHPFDSSPWNKSSTSFIALATNNSNIALKLLEKGESCTVETLILSAIKSPKDEFDKIYNYYYSQPLLDHFIESKSKLSQNLIQMALFSILTTNNQKIFDRILERLPEVSKHLEVPLEPKERKDFKSTESTDLQSKPIKEQKNILHLAVLLANKPLLKHFDKNENLKNNLSKLSINLWFNYSEKQFKNQGDPKNLYVPLNNSIANCLASLSFYNRSFYTTDNIGVNFLKSSVPDEKEEIGNSDVYSQNYQEHHNTDDIKRIMEIKLSLFECAALSQNENSLNFVNKHFDKDFKQISKSSQKIDEKYKFETTANVNQVIQELKKANTTKILNSSTAPTEQSNTAPKIARKRKL